MMLLFIVGVITLIVVFASICAFIEGLIFAGIMFSLLSSLWIILFVEMIRQEIKSIKGVKYETYNSYIKR